MYKVSVITLTRNRPEFIDRAINQFLMQDYKHKEMHIVYDNWVKDFTQETYRNLALKRYKNILFHPIENINHFSIGIKRNQGIERSQTDIICHFDDDDFYSLDWITKSVQHLIETKADITGLSQAYFSHPPHLYEYTYQGGQPYVIGASMCYWRRVWEKQPFKHINSGEDALFQVNNVVIPHTYKEGFTANIHGGNTASHLQLNKKEFRLVK